jgi:hypothetical protein
MPLGIITLEDVLEGTCAARPCFSSLLTFGNRADRGRDLQRVWPARSRTQLSSFIPPDSDAGGTVPTIAINDPGHDDSHHRIHATGHGIHAPNLGSGNGPSIGSGPGFGHGPAIIKPIALRAKEGLGALTSRSKSAPPIPRDQVGKHLRHSPVCRPR